MCDDCIMDKKIFCVACKTLMACITIMLVMLSIYVWMIIMPIYLSILYAYQIKCVVVSWYPCYIDVILCILSICHTISSHDYTQLLRHHTLCKIVQLSSHMPLSVIFMVINSCISLRGALYTNLKNKTLSCLIVEKL
jgi:hypothetical protein